MSSETRVSGERLREVLFYLARMPDGGNRHWGSEYSREIGKDARTALTELLERRTLETPPLAAQDGWVLVPREPTQEMTHAALNRSRVEQRVGELPAGKQILPRSFELWASEQVYAAMLAAAPTPPSQAIDAGDGEAKPFVYGIRDLRDGTPHFDELCVSVDAQDLEDHIEGDESLEVIPLYTHPAAGRVSVSDAEWLRDTAMNVMLATEVEEAIRQSFARAMAPCEHGVRDFEDCPDCRRLALKEAGDV